MPDTSDRFKNDLNHKSKQSESFTENDFSP